MKKPIFIQEADDIANAIKKIEKSVEWIDKYNPRLIDDFIFPQQTKDLIKKWVTLGYDEKTDEQILNMPNIMLIGTAGLGKTTLANVICNELNIEPKFINASMMNSIDVVRNEINDYAQYKSITNMFTNKIDKKIIVLDEFDNFSTDAQKALRGLIEQYKNSVRFIATLNYPEKVLDPIKSRFTSGMIDYDKLYGENKKEVITCMVNRIKYILDTEKIEYKKDVIVDAIKMHYPDIRSVMMTLYKTFLQYGDLTQIDKNMSVNALIEIIKKGDVKQMHEYAKNNYLYSKIFRELRLYYVNSGQLLALIKIAEKAEVLSVSIDKTISILDLMLNLHSMYVNGEIK